MDKIIKSIYRLVFKGYCLRSWDDRKFRRIEVYIPQNLVSPISGGYNEGWNEVAKLDTLSPEDRIEEDKREERFECLKIMYRFVLIHGWYVSNFHDKFHSGNYMCFMVRSPDCRQRDIVRFPI